MPVLEFRGVSKYFYRHGGRMLLRDRLAYSLGTDSRERFYALRDVSFSLEHGESMAVIGSNGAGKSTLLNIATSLCDPSDGSVRAEGRVEALLELGAGFHPDLTGAENLRIKASLMGLTRRQVRERFDPIVEFSELGEFIQEPLRTYSAGMVMRLAFSVAINVDPELLIIDEVLGVGDQNFFTKCVDKIMEFRHAGKSILCVSHALDTLERLCDRGLWLEHGRVIKVGKVSEVLKAYRESATAQAPVAAQTS
ncbi:MAG TPA: ABC transporter ATP-binding protein [Bryobacteraceae bacterium]|nr:ABC transporter ATP-binding protein [Bryobacteraceae bacterium]